MAPGNARRCGNCSTAETTQVANAIEFSASLAAQTALAGLGRAGCGGRLVKSPRTRMLTRMLMVQMSKHMVMQSRTIPFCNSLFEQSCTCFPCYQSAVWSGKCRVWSVECEVRSVECKVWSGECSVKCRV